MSPYPLQKSDPNMAAAEKIQKKQIFGVGEMADRTRKFDWSSTPVGPIEQWPGTLLTTVNTLLASRHPMFLWWGEDLIQFYNDAYRPSIREDKHPRALGQRGKECWPEIWPIIGPQIEVVMTRGEASWHENQLVPIYRNGKLEDVYWTYSYSPVRDPHGKICGTLVVCTDTTGIVTARLQLQKEREQLADLFQQTQAFFAVLGGPQHVFEMVNPRYHELVGKRNILGKTLQEAVPEVTEQGFITILDKVYESGESYVGRGTPVQLATNDSESLELHYLDFVYQPRRDANGTITGIIVVGMDVTENKRVEQALLQSEKLAAVGRLASSIAHEINNPLEAVVNLLYLVRESEISPDARKYLSAAESELQRVAAIASQTLRFHRQATHPQIVQCVDLIEGILPLYRGKFANAGIDVQRRDRSRCTVKCFEGEIRQVLSNLIGNAIDAMGHEGGRLLIRSRKGTDWKTGRTGVVFTIADTGSGMSSATLSRIFEPFFTTKGLVGTGLGLWISRDIVDRNGGALQVRSSQSGRCSGTVFALFLPFNPPIVSGAYTGSHEGV
ncbi:MAG: ATP-binding protein [Acidobacteriaceae bacterium]